MKQIYSQDIALIDDFVLDHPSTIYTNDYIEVNIFSDETELTTFIASKGIANFPIIPNIGGWCEKDKIYAYGTDKVKCLQSHNRMSFTPEQTPALWLIITTVSQSDYPVWVQPTGAHNAYALGDRVHFPTATDPVYESLIAANVWSPTVYPAGWKKL